MSSFKSSNVLDMTITLTAAQRRRNKDGKVEKICSNGRGSTLRWVY